MKKSQMQDSLGDTDVTAEQDSSQDPSFPIPDHLPKAVGFLLSQLGFEVAGRFSKLMADVQLEPRQFAVMRAIQAAQGMSQNQVGEWLRIPPSSMVSVIDQLEMRGLVERRPHPTDRRSRLLHITTHGTETLDRATVLAMGLEQTICEGFSPEVRGELIKLLDRVTENLGLVQGLHPGVPSGSHDHEGADSAH
jgi:DNA-binding MarR family transcriptional regulator